MINNRLQTIISLINDNSIGIVDVGTDHGYLPIELARNGFNGKIYASDLRQKPLNVAINNAQYFNVIDKIHFYISDGLNDCDSNNIDTIVIAGMGGDLICDILDKAEWTMSSNYKIILQAMSKAEVLRYWLINNGYNIINEYPVEDMGRYYSIIEVKYTGINQQYSDAELYVGKNPDTYHIKSAIKSLSKKPYNKFNDLIIKELMDYDCK